VRGGGAGLLRGGGGGASRYNPHRSLCITTTGGAGYNTSRDQVLAWVPEDPRAARRGGKAQYARVQATEGEGDGKEEGEGEGAAAAGGASKSVYALPAPEEEEEGAYRAPSYLALLRPVSPWASLSSSDDIHLNALNTSCDRMYLCAHSVAVGA
jgi:hypothetical protein